MKFKEELLRILMNAVLLVLAASVSIIYKSAHLSPFLVAGWGFSTAIVLLAVAWVISRGIDKKPPGQ